MNAGLGAQIREHRQTEQACVSEEKMPSDATLSPKTKAPALQIEPPDNRPFGAWLAVAQRTGKGGGGTLRGAVG